VFRYLPDLISVFRLLAGFFLLILYDPLEPSRFGWALTLIVLAELSDHLDGRLARLMGTASMRGYILDGVADRAFYCALILLAFDYHRPHIVIVYLLIFGQVLVYAARLLQDNWYRKNTRVRFLHLLHWAGIRIWTLSFVVVDAAIVWKDFHLELDSLSWYLAMQSAVGFATIAVLYSAISLCVVEGLRSQN